MDAVHIRQQFEFLSVFFCKGQILLRFDLCVHAVRSGNNLNFYQSCGKAVSKSIEIPGSNQSSVYFLLLLILSQYFLSEEHTIFNLSRTDKRLI